MTVEYIFEPSDYGHMSEEDLEILSEFGINLSKGFEIYVEIVDFWDHPAGRHDPGDSGIEVGGIEVYQEEEEVFISRGRERCEKFWLIVELLGEEGDIADRFFDSYNPDDYYDGPED